MTKAQSHDLFFSALPNIDYEFLSQCLSPHDLRRAIDHAQILKADLAQLIVQCGYISQEAYFEALAAYCGIPLLSQTTYEDNSLEGFTIVELAPLLPSGLMRATRTLQQQKIKWCLCPSHLARKTYQQRHRLTAVEQAITGLARKMPKNCAANLITKRGLTCLLLFTGLLTLGLNYAGLNPIWLFSLFGVAFFYLIACLRLSAAFHAAQLPSSNEDWTCPIKDQDLPIYTILIPLYKEALVVPTLIQSLLAIDYPPTKLDIKLLLEETDVDTINQVKQMNLPACFETLIVPDKAPRTKPKALNYGLQYAMGTYVVIYDAEDRPDPLQLKKAVVKFWTSASNLACIQGKLNYFNPHENWLTKQFTIEYTCLFDGFLPTLKKLDLPIPLGGTSNHFKRDILQHLGGWDPYNVTEDADLGMRFYRYGYTIDLIDSTTYEEANCQLKNWITQRTRWIKGWIITYLVHMRRPLTLFKDLGAWRFLGFQAIIGGFIISSFIHPLFIIYFLYHPEILGDLFTNKLASPFVSLSLFNLTLGYVSVALLALACLYKRGLAPLHWSLIYFPLYWLCISFAAYRALSQIFISPFHWEKTHHGISKEFL